jgi:hypothetical protein
MEYSLRYGKAANLMGARYQTEGEGERVRGRGRRIRRERERERERDPIFSSRVYLYNLTSFH